MNKKKTLDLTEGPILKTLAQLAFPIMASSFLSTAYNITDMAWIGMLGSRAVAGVGVGGMYVWLSQGLVSLARMGGQVHVAQCCGKNERNEAKKYAAAAVRMTGLFGVLFALVCLVFTEQLVHFFKLNDAAAFTYAESYMKITCGLIVFSYLNLTLTGIFTAQGDSRTPFRANLLGLVTNMILDPLMILGIGPFPRMEVIGAAVATVTAQVLVMFVLVIHVCRSANGENVLKEISISEKIPGSYYKDICRIGGPTALQGTLYSMISMVLTRMVSVFGPGAVAVQRVGGQIECIAWNTADGFASALNAFTGQNYGAGKSGRIRDGYKVSLISMILWGTLVMLLFLIFPEQICRLFFYEQEVVGIGVNYMRYLAVGEAFMCVELMTIGALSGLGKTKLCSVISIILTGSRIPLAFLLTGTTLGLNGIWLTLTITSVAKGIAFCIAFYKVSRKLD